MSARRGRRRKPIRSLLLPSAALQSRRWLLLGLASVVALAGCGSHSSSADWPLPNHDLASTRALPGSGITSKNVAALRVAWKFRLQIRPGYSGSDTATPVVAGGVVYLQDMNSNVYALDLKTGTERWRAQFDDTNQGPDGVAVVGDRVYGATDTSVFALSTATGKLLWTQRLVTATQQFVNIAPQVAGGTVYAATIGNPPGGAGELYAIDAKSGQDAVEVQDDQGSLEAPVPLRRRRRLVHAERLRERRLLGDREPAALGWQPQVSERSCLRRRRALHGLAGCAERARPASCSGTTR